jgi:hypothetical protein
MTPPVPTQHAFAAPAVRLCVGFTGHRDLNPTFAANQSQIEGTLARLFDCLDEASRAQAAMLSSGWVARTRLCTLLAPGGDQLALQLAQARQWEVTAPLPFGIALNITINARPASAADAAALLAGADTVRDPSVLARARALRTACAGAQLFELAEQDARIASLLLASLADGAGADAQRACDIAVSERAAVAARVMVEQCDFLVAVWDGLSGAAVGGTAHTIAAALDVGTTVVWVDARAPDRWRILRAPEILAIDDSDPQAGVASAADLQELVTQALVPVMPGAVRRQARVARSGVDALQSEHWHTRSNPLLHAYRRIEALFGSESWADRLRSLRQQYETPERIAAHSGARFAAAACALPDGDHGFATRLIASVLPRFAWANGMGTYLSDAYRGGMVANFLLAAVAIIGGLLWLPFGAESHKWWFALLEFLLLSGILTLTAVASRRRWHGRWFESRRVAEYLRHAPILLLLGSARPAGRWPRGPDTSWPEWYARQTLRELGLPRIAVSTSYLRSALRDLLRDHVVSQRDYHRDKARRLAKAHHRLDGFGVLLFKLAIVAVAAYLVLKAGGSLGWWSAAWASAASKPITFLGVLFPTLGGAFAGIRYFGDFERFAAISSVTAAKLDAINDRIGLLLAAPDAELRYQRVSDLAHAVDDVVMTEIENWQAVFAGKHVTVPV